MKTITIIAEQISDRALAAAIPTKGVESISVSENRTGTKDNVVADTYRCFRNPRRFSANYRIELVVDDAAVGTVFDGISFAYGAGVFSDAEMWLSTTDLALSA